MASESRLRERRRRAGLSQDGLAQATGLSRQAIGAIEAGRHRPGVDAALALAAALDCTVAALFATGDTTGPPEASVPVGGEPLPDGTAVFTARVGDRHVHAPATLAAWQERWPVAEGRWAAGVIEPLADTPTAEGFVVVGCDPALALAAAQLPASGPRRLVVVNGSTRTAIRALTEGRAHAALVHGRPGTLPAAPAGTRRVHLARWRVGVATAAAGRPSLTALAGAGLVQREAGASSQQALLRALQTAGAPAPAASVGPTAGGHLAVTARVLAGAPAGVTMEPAAVHHGLTFLALEEHDVQLWIGAAHRDHPAVDALGAVLVSRMFHARLAAIGGYDLTGCGASPQEHR